jgi:hypothetical protein
VEVASGPQKSKIASKKRRNEAGSFTSSNSPSEFSTQLQEPKRRRFKSEEVEFVDYSPQTVTIHPPPISLSKEQHNVLKMVREGQNVFFTGSAGPQVF